MKTEKKRSLTNEFYFENNNPDNLFKVTIPRKWWCVQNSYNTHFDYDFKIIKLVNKKELTKTPSRVNGWDIRKGDFIFNDNQTKRILTQKERLRNEFLFLILFTLLSCLFILLISILLSKSV